MERPETLDVLVNNLIKSVDELYLRLEHPMAFESTRIKECKQIKTKLELLRNELTYFPGSSENILKKRLGYES